MVRVGADRVAADGVVVRLADAMELSLLERRLLVPAGLGPMFPEPPLDSALAAGLLRS